jgi:hypothetical protein
MRVIAVQDMRIFVTVGMFTTGNIDSAFDTHKE